jgi:hypothetical protein
MVSVDVGSRVAVGASVAGGKVGVAKAGVSEVDNAEGGVAVSEADVSANGAEGEGVASSPPHPVRSTIKTTSKVRFINQFTFQFTLSFIESKSESPKLIDWSNIS